MLSSFRIGAIVKEHEELFSFIENKNKEKIEQFFNQHFNGGIKRLGKRIYSEYAGYFEPETKDEQSIG